MSNQKTVFATIKALVGQANILTIPRVFIDLTGAIEYAEKEGWLTSQTLTGKTNSKGILWVER